MRASARYTERGERKMGPENQHIYFNHCRVNKVFLARPGPSRTSCWSTWESISSDIMHRHGMWLIYVQGTHSLVESPTFVNVLARLQSACRGARRRYKKSMYIRKPTKTLISPTRRTRRNVNSCGSGNRIMMGPFRCWSCYNSRYVTPCWK